MCTAITFQTLDHYFGRNLDLEYSYQETVAITPRNYPFKFRKADAKCNHYAMIGMATVADNYPLYYEATNEFGLSIAGLNFPDNAVYNDEVKDKDNIAPFEFIPWILCQCRNLDDSEKLLSNLNLVNLDFSDKYSVTPLHWLIADMHRAITVEPLRGELKIYENPVGVLTNNPPFDYHMHHLCEYMNLSSNDPINNFSSKIDLRPYSRGMGTMGLPGDLSSASRFVRATFTKFNSQCDFNEIDSVSQFFHILGSITQQNGCNKIGDHYEKTVYSSCCNMDKGIYYYSTYDNRQITAINMRGADHNSSNIKTYPLVKTQQIRYE